MTAAVVHVVVRGQRRCHHVVSFGNSLDGGVMAVELLNVECQLSSCLDV